MSDEQKANSNDSGPGPEHFRQVAARLSGQIAEICQSVQVPLENLDGSVRTVPLDQAEQQAAIRSEDLRASMQAVVIDAKLRDHDHHALSKDRAEPQTLREWVAAVTSGKAAVALASGGGAFSMRVLQLCLIAGLVGLSVQSSGTVGLIERAKTLELGLIAKSNDAALVKASENAPRRDEAPSCAAALGTCADEATTIARLRTVFRAGAARAFQQEVAGAGRVAAEVHHAVFELGAVDARRAILTEGARPAAPSLDPGVEGHEFRSSASPQSRVSAASDTLDDAFRRRVEILRAHEPTWHRLEIWAARPVAADYAGEAFLRTALGDVNGPSLHSVRAWSEEASFQFTSDVIRGGDPAAAAHSLSTRRIETPVHFGTARDQRLFRDFSAGVPERVNTELAAYNSGAKDPGSLRRTFAKAGEHIPNSYNDFFPPAAGPEPNAVPRRGSAGGASVDRLPSTSQYASGGGGRAFTNVASARSYGRVRFSGRIGGVVFGRPADGGGTAPDVVDLKWELVNANAMTLVARMRDGGIIRLGPYHPAVIHHALTFVADGRVVVATLPQPLDEPRKLFTVPARRVIVHPAFEDTAFACNAIQIDRFVDAFTGSQPAGQSSARTKRIKETRTGVSYLGLVLASSKPLEGEPADEVLAGIQRHMLTCKGDEACFPLQRYRAMGIDFGSAEKFLACLRDDGDAAHRRDCLRNFELARTGNAYIVDSGVRERAYKVDPKLGFVSGTENRDDKTWPIEFMIQAVPQLAHEGDLNVSGGQDPWQFPTIAEDVQAAVVEGIEGNADAQNVFRNVRDFVALQRLFRTALNGELGESFPLDALVRLSSDTKRYVRVQRNERWNVNESFFSFATAVRQVSLEEIQKASPQLQTNTTCKQRVDDIVASANRDQAGYFDFWRSFAKIDVDCAQERSLAKLLRIQSELRRQDVIGQVLEFENVDKTARRGALFCEAL